MRLIDADKLIRDIEDYHLSDGKFQHWIKLQPTIEPSAEPVRMKGQWSVTPDDGRLVCSCCYKNPTNRIIVNGNLIYDMTPIRKRMKFCPNCGADMRKGGEDAAD